MKRSLLTCLLAMLLALFLTACGGSSASTTSASTDTAAAEADYGYNGEVSDASAAGTGERKIIRTASLNLETTEFDQATAALSQLTADCGGWFASSSVNHRGSGYRYADYTVRIPVERYSDYLNRAGQTCHLLYQEEYEDDITTSYYDTAGRLKTQQIKLERLQALLAQAEKMEDIITIESAISETEQQIDDLSGTVQHYDDQVDYATVYISLQEVYKLSNVEETPDSYGSRLGSAFAGGWRDFVDGLEDVTVALAYGWMWVILLVVIVVVVVRILGKRRRHKLPPVEKNDSDKQP
jgi:hypothetical protein